MKHLLCTLMLLGAPVFAETFKSPQSQQVADQLVDTINRKISDIAALEMAAGAAPEDITLALQQAARVGKSRFGVVLDAGTPGRVLSVTPDSPAAVLGLLSGDVLLRINDHPVGDDDKLWLAALQATAVDKPLAVNIDRDGDTRLLHGTLAASYQPQWQLSSQLPEIPTLAEVTAPAGCGRIIVGYAYGRLNAWPYGRWQRVAEVTEIDGIKVGTPDRQKRFKLKAGRHNIKVMAKTGRYPRKAHGITIEPNTSYYLGYSTAGEVTALGANAEPSTLYEGPVVIKIKEESCTL